MNIFVLHENPIVAAQMENNKHIIKMFLESCQLLCSPFEKEDGAPYKRTHYNHPCSIWVRTSKQNYMWLLEHTSALNEEYSNAYKKTHKCLKVLNWCKENYHLLNLPDIGLTPFALAMPEQYKVAGDAVTSYRNYYKGDKAGFSKWTHGRQQPYWW